VPQPQFAAGLLQDGRFVRVDPADELPLVADARLVTTTGGGGLAVCQPAERESDRLQAGLGGAERESLRFHGSRGLQSLPRWRSVIAERTRKSGRSRW